MTIFLYHHGFLIWKTILLSAEIISKYSVVSKLSCIYLFSVKTAWRFKYNQFFLKYIFTYIYANTYLGLVNMNICMFQIKNEKSNSIYIISLKLYRNHVRQIFFFQIKSSKFLFFCFYSFITSIYLFLFKRPFEHTFMYKLKFMRIKSPLILPASHRGNYYYQLKADILITPFYTKKQWSKEY